MPVSSQSAPGPPPRVVVSLLVGLLCLVWGSTWLVIQGGLRDLPPFLSAGARFAVAAAVMAAIAPRLARREGGRRPPLSLVLLLGLLNFAVSYGVVYQVETVLPSGLVCVLWGIFPILMAAIGHAFLPGERLGPSAALGFAVGFSGLVVLFAADLRALGRESFGAACLLLLSPAASAVGQAVIKRRAGGMSSVLLNRDAMAVGAVVLLGVSALTERGSAPLWTARALASIAYLACVGTVLTFGVYFWLLRTARSSQLSLIAYVTPAVALWLGARFGGEEVRATTVAGTLLVALGVALSARRQACPQGQDLPA